MPLFSPLKVKMWEGSALEKGRNNLRQLLRASHIYADTGGGQLPATATYDKQGRALLSWRVQLLPFLKQDKLYRQFHLDEPWDSEHNKKLIPMMPPVFALAKSPLNALGKTVYLAPTGKGLAFEGTKGLRFPSAFVDGTANTILFVEADDAHAVIWTKPEDLAVDLNNPQKGLGRHFGPGFLVGMLDGSARFVSAYVDKATLKALFTRNGGEPLGPDW
jgi:hypothetical protein